MRPTLGSARLGGSEKFVARSNHGIKPMNCNPCKYSSKPSLARAREKFELNVTEEKECAVMNEHDDGIVGVVIG